MRSMICLLLLIVSVGLASSCREQESNGAFGGSDQLDMDRAEVRRLARQMAAAKTMRDNPDDEAAYEEAKEALILLGSGIQGVLFEELAGSNDWGVRYGIVNVLSAIGTKRMVEPLIAVLDDPEPQVAWMSMQVLQVVCGYSPIPDTVDANDAAAASGLPPIPVGPDDGLSQERLWTEWHGINSTAHKAAWQSWWDDNQHRVQIE